MCISCGIRLVSLLVLSLRTCGLFTQTISFRYHLRKQSGGLRSCERVARGYRFNAKWVCPLGSYVWGIEVFCSSNEVAPHLAETQQCSNQCLSSFSMQQQTFRGITSKYRSALPVTRSTSLSSKKYNLKILPLPIAYHTVTFSWLNGCWLCLWGCWDGQNLMFYLLTCPLRWKWTSSLNRIKPRSLGLFSILSLLSFLFASVCFWRIRTLYGNNFK